MFIRIEEIAYWSRNIEIKHIEFNKSNICENKFSTLIQEEFFRNLKIETEDLIKGLVEQLNDLKVSIKVNENKLNKEKEEFVNQTEKLLKSLEQDKNYYKQKLKQSSETELITIQEEHEATKSNMILQLQSFKEINKRLLKQKSQLYANVEQLLLEKKDKLQSLEREMIDNYEITGNEQLALIENSYVKILKEQETTIISLRHKRNSILENIKTMEMKRKHEADSFYGKLIRSSRKTRK